MAAAARRYAAAAWHGGMANSLTLRRFSYNISAEDYSQQTT
jgi:hypothetical protein